MRQCGQKKKEPVIYGPPHNIIAVRKEGTTVLMCVRQQGCRNMENCALCESAMEKKYRDIIGGIPHSWWKTSTAYPVEKLDNFLKGHNREACHLANLEEEGKSKITTDDINNSDTWKAARGFVGRSEKDNGYMCYGVLIKAVEKESWITNSKIAVPLRVSTATATEIA